MARKSRKNVGLIGLGIIGTRIAAGLRAGGYHVFVWNRTPKPAPNFVGSPAEVAEICDVIQIFVADAAAVRDVIESFGDQLGPRHTIINCATIGPEATVEIAQIVQGRGANFLDCPFTGSKGAADKAQLVYYVGGEESVFLKVKPVLEATSKAIVRCGRVGDAATLKIATNLITAVTTQTLAEALAIVQSVGIKPEALTAALEHNACKSGVVELKLPKMISGDYEPHFSVKHMFKDVQLGIHMANENRLEVPLTTVVGGVLYGALCSGWGDLDFASLYRVYSDAARPAPAALPEPAESTGDAEVPEGLTDTAPTATTAPVPLDSEATQRSEAGGSEEKSVGSGDAIAAARAESAPLESGTPAFENGGANSGHGDSASATDNDPFRNGSADHNGETSTAPKEENRNPAEETAQRAEDKDTPPADAQLSGAVVPAATAEPAASVSTSESAAPAAESSSGAGDLATDASDTASAANPSATPGPELAETAASGADADEDRGLAGFFSRVFRRKAASADTAGKGTPVNP